MLPLDKATYRARAAGCSFGVSENGNTQIAIECIVVDFDGPNGDRIESGHAGESIAWIGHFTDKTAARTIESLQHLGWTGDDLSELDNLSPEQCAQLLPNEVDLVCEPEEYQGEWSLRVKWVNKPGAGKFTFKKPLTGGDLKAFAAQMRGTIRGARGAASARQQKPAGNGGSRSGGGRGYGGGHPNDPDNDIPFATASVGAEPSPIARVLR